MTTVFITQGPWEEKIQDSLSQPFHGSDATNAPFQRTSSSVHSWLVGKWATKRGCSRRSQCTQETWRPDAEDRGKRSSLSLPEGTENSECPQWVHRCSRQKRGSSEKEKNGSVKVEKAKLTQHSALSCLLHPEWLSYSKEKMLLVLPPGQELSFHQVSM